MKLLTNNFNILLANTFFDSVKTDNYFVFAARTLPWANGTPEVPGNSIDDTFLSINEEMIFGKYITNDDVRIMIEKKDWEEGVVYPIYDHQDDDLPTKKFYVVTRDGDEYSIFKCIDNNNNSVSLIKPIKSETSPSDDFYRTSDNYVWKLMYTITDEIYDKFATSKYVPLEADVEISNNAIAGGIECIAIDSTGGGYENYLSGTISQINVGGNTRKLYIQSATDTLSTLANYYTDSAFYITSGNGQGQLKSIIEYGIEGNNRYVILDSSFSPSVSSGDEFEISPNITIVGDGSGFQGRAIVDETTKRLERVDIINRGTGYTQAVATVVSNTAAFDANTYSAAAVRPIISPKGGHGFDAQQELFGRYIGMSVDFIQDTLPAGNNDFRRFGIIKEPTFRRADITVSSVSGLANGDIIVQANTGATGTIQDIDFGNTALILTDVQGVFDTGNTVSSGNTSFTVSTIEKNNDLFDQRTTLDVTVTFGVAFQKDEIVIQQNTNASAVVQDYTAGVLKLINVQGNFSISGVSSVDGQTSGTRAVINNITQPDMIKGTADTIYIENIEAITRAADRTERTKIIIGF